VEIAKPTRFPCAEVLKRAVAEVVQVSARSPRPTIPAQRAPQGLCELSHAKYQVVDIPVEFTDHQIRVVRPN